ncbi:hypothetical protein Hanom_Chr00s001124g01674351 [Helianthus anomalus]
MEVSQPSRPCQPPPPYRFNVKEVKNHAPPPSTTFPPSDRRRFAATTTMEVVGVLSQEIMNSSEMGERKEGGCLVGWNKHLRLPVGLNSGYRSSVGEGEEIERCV